MLSRRLLLALELAPPGRGLLLLVVSDAPDEPQQIAAQLVAEGHAAQLCTLDTLDADAANVVDARAWNDHECRAANLARPLIAERRVVLVASATQLERLRALAPDLFDWISHADGLRENAEKAE